MFVHSVNGALCDAHCCISASQTLFTIQLNTLSIITYPAEASCQQIGSNFHVISLHTNKV